MRETQVYDKSRHSRYALELDGGSGVDLRVDRIFGSEITKRLQWAGARIVASNEIGAVECGS